MPLKSCSDLVLDERSPSCSSQSSATETYTVPLGTSTEIDFKYDDEQVANILDKIPIGKPNGNVTTIIGDNNLVGAKVNIGVDAESTTININHYHPKPDPDAVDDDESKNNDEILLTTRPLKILLIFALFAFALSILSTVYLITKSLPIGKFNKSITNPQQTNKSTMKIADPDEFSSKPETTEKIGLFVTRILWKAEPLEVNLIRNAGTRHVVSIKSTKNKFCTNFSDCSEEVKVIQAFDINQSQFEDIRYNFLVGGDGRIYEGRGWEFDNGESNLTIEIAFIGDFDKDEPTQAMLTVTKVYIEVGQSFGHLSASNLCIRAPVDVGEKLISKVEQFFAVEDYVDCCNYNF